MLLPVVAVVVQAVAAVSAPTVPGERPVRVWLGTSGPIAQGDPVRVYVETAADGYLLVLREASDGRVEVLFPGDPSSDPHATPGTYELQRAGDQPAFAAAEPAGAGLVFAALSPAPFRFAEFLRAGAWNPDALVASWTGADPEAALTDIVQRMLGDGYFNYDVVQYSVVPRPYALESAPAPLPAPAPAPAYGPCVGCSFVAVTLVEPLVPFLCDPFFVACDGFVPIVHQPRIVDRGICQIGSTCPAGVGASAIALDLRSASRAGVAPKGGSPSRFGMRRRPAGPTPPGPAVLPPPLMPPPPRSRPPQAGGAPVAPVAPGTGVTRIVALPVVGRRAAVAPRWAVGGAGDGGSGAVPVRARLVLPRVPMLAPSSEPPRVEAVPVRPGSAVVVLEGAASAAPPRAFTRIPAATALAAPAASPRAAVVPSRASPASSPPSAGSGAASRAIALPRAASTGVAPRVARTTARRP